MNKEIEIKIYISFYFIAVITLMSIFDNNYNLLYSLVAISLHELSHLFFIIIFGGELKSFKFSLCEMNINIQKAGLSKIQNGIIAFSGPLINIILYILFINYIPEFATINMTIAVFQLLPIISLDGDSILESFSINLKFRKIISFILCVIFAFFGFYILIRSKYNFSLLTISLYLLFLTCKSSKNIV